MAEIYAAFLAYDDYNIGRVIDAVKAGGLADNTLIIFIEGDNGGSAEGTLQGTANEVARHRQRRDGELRLPLFDQGRARRAAPLQPYAGAVVVGVRYAVPVDQALRQPFRRHPQRHGDELAEAHQGRRGLARAVPLRDRHHADDSRGRRRAGAGHDQRRRSNCRSTASRWPTPGTTPRRRRAAPRSCSRCSAIAASITTAGWPRPRRSCSPGSRSRRGITPESFNWELYDLNKDFSQGA